MRQKGNILLVVLVLVGMVAASIGGYLWWKVQKQKTGPVPIMEVKPKEATSSANEGVIWKTYVN